MQSREVVSNNHFERDKDPLHVPWNGSRFFDDLDFANQTAVWCVDLNEVRFADAGLFNQLEPVGRGSVEGFALPRNQRGDDLVKDRNLIGESEFVVSGSSVDHTCFTLP